MIYSGVISADRPQEAATLAKRFQNFGIRQIKVKVGTGEDVARLQAVLEAVGGAPSNCAPMPMERGARRKRWGN